MNRLIFEIWNCITVRRVLGGALAAWVLLEPMSCPSAETVVFEAEAFATVNAKRLPESGAQWVKFTTPTEIIQTPFQLKEKENFSLWVRVLFKHGGSDTVFVSIDGRKPERVSDADYGRWHWLHAGDYEEVVPEMDIHEKKSEDLLGLELESAKPKSGKVVYLASGAHTLALTPAIPLPDTPNKFDSPGLGVKIDKVLLYFGDNPTQEKWYLEDDFPIYASPLPPQRLLGAVGSALGLEAEAADRVVGTIRADKEALGEKAVEFRNDGEEITFAIGAPEDRTAQVWVRAFFDTAQRITGDANSFRFYLDGSLRSIAADEDKDRWHWIRVGEYRLQKGPHLVKLRGQALPVRIDKLVFYAGNNARSEGWYTEAEPMAALVFSHPPQPGQVFAASASNLFLEAEKGVIAGGAIQAFGENKRAVMLSEAAGAVHLVTGVDEDGATQILILAYSEESPSRLRLYIDGELKKVLVLGDTHKWVFLDAGQHALSKGPHVISVRRVDANVMLDRVVLYRGQDFRKEKWYQKYDRLARLRFSEDIRVAPNKTLKPGEKVVGLELEDADLTAKAVVELGEAGAKSVVFKEPGSEAHILIGLESPATFEVWAKLYYDALHATLQGANGVNFSLDGETPPKRLRDSFGDEWHWVKAGRYDLAAGRHILSFYSAALPVKLDKLVLYAGANAAKEDWYQAGPHVCALPFDLSNAVSQAKAQHVSHWRVFGELADRCRLNVTRDMKQTQERAIGIGFPAGVSGKKLVLERRTPLKTPEAFVDRSQMQQISLWLHGNGSGLEIKGIYEDSSGELFEGVFAAGATGEGWRELHLNIGKDSRYPQLRSQGVLGNGVVDYPVNFRYLVFTPRDNAPRQIHFEEPFFTRPFSCRAAPTATRDTLSPGDALEIRFTIANASDVSNQTDLAYHFGPQAEPPGQETRMAVVVSGKAATEKTVRLIPPQAGVYRLTYGVGSAERKRLYFGVGEAGSQQIARFKAELEQEHGAFRFSPDGKDMPLNKLDGTPIQLSEVEKTYGENDGIGIFCGGTDVCSEEYAVKQGLRRLAPKGYDLSDAAGWPEIRVPPGEVAIDPRLGRFKFSEGNSNRVAVVGSSHTGFGVPGVKGVLRGDYAFYPPGEGDMTILDVSDKKNPRVVSYIQTWSFYRDAHFYKDYVYYTENRGTEPFLINVNDPIYPFDRRRADFTGRIRHIWEEADLAYVEVPGKLNIVDLSANPSNPDVVGEIADCSSLVLSRDRRYGFTYSQDQTRIRILDLKNPRNPEIVTDIANLAREGKDRDGKPITLHGRIAAISRSLMAVCVGADIILFDISDISRPFKRCTYSVSAGAPVYLTGMGFYGDNDCYDQVYLYVLDARAPWEGAHGGGARLFVLDVMNRDQPRLVYTHQGAPRTKYQSLTLAGDYAYVGDGNFGLRVFDFHDPQFPEEIGQVPTAAEGHFLEVQGNMAYMVHTFGGTLYAIDVGDPVNPKQLGTFWDGCWFPYHCGPSANIIAARGDVVYLAKSGGGIQLLDVKNPARPRETGRIDGGFFHIQGDTLYTVNAKALYAYDISSASQPTRVGQLELPWSCMLLPPGAGTLYLVGNAGRGFAVVDVSDRSAPRIVSTFNLDSVGDEGEESFGIGEVARGYAYLTSGTSLYILDIRNPQNIRFVKRVDPMGNHGLPGWANFYEDLLAEGDYLFVCNYGQIEVMNIADPENPRFIEQKRMGYQWAGGRIQGEYLYVPTLRGLWILDIPHSSQVPKGKITTSLKSALAYAAAENAR